MKTTTYWENNGRFQALADKLQKLIPASGPCADAKTKNKHLERFRRAVNCYYDLNNNGLCNRAAEFRAVFGWGCVKKYRYLDSGHMNFEAIEKDGIVEKDMDKFVFDAAIEQGIFVPAVTVCPEFMAVLEFLESCKMSGFSEEERQRVIAKAREVIKA